MQVTQQAVLEYGTAVRSLRREPSDSLWERIALLDEDDRTILELSLRVGASVRQIARALKRPAGSVSRKLRGLGRRLHDPLVLALCHPECPLDPQYRQIGVERFLCRRNAAELARRHEMPVIRVRRILQFVRTWHRGVDWMPRRNADH